MIESQDIPSFNQDFNNMIQYFCNRHKLEYKQDINEIVSQFLLLSYQLNMSYSESYIFFDSFMYKYSIGYYHIKTYTPQSIRTVCICLVYCLNIISHLFHLYFKKNPFNQKCIYELGHYCI